MYALLNDNDELVSGEPVQIFRKSKAETFNGVQHPRNWWQAYPVAQKESLHVFPITRPPVNPDPQQEDSGNFTYSFDGTEVLETPELIPVTLTSYKDAAYKQIDAELARRIQAAEMTPTAGVDYTDNARGLAKSIEKRNNKAKRKGANPISDAEDHLFDHIDILHDAADSLGDFVEAAIDLDAVDAIPITDDASWPTWTPM